MYNHLGCVDLIHVFERRVCFRRSDGLCKNCCIFMAFSSQAVNTVTIICFFQIQFINSWRKVSYILTNERQDFKALVKYWTEALWPCFFNNKYYYERINSRKLEPLARKHFTFEEGGIRVYVSRGLVQS